MSDGEALVIAVIFLISASILLKMGFTKIKTYMKIKNTPTETVQSLSMGRTELEGVVDEKSEPIAPVLDVPSDTSQPVYCSWEIEERVRTTKGKKRWRSRMNEIESGRLFVSDETGVVEVDIGEVDEATIMDTENEQEKTYSAGEPFDDSILNHIGQYIEGDLFDNSNKITRTKNRRRITQEILPIGNDCYVLGQAIEKTDNEATDIGTINQDSAIITEDTDSGLFVISDGCEEETTQWYLTAGITAFVLGVIFAIIAVEILAPQLGWNTLLNYISPLF